MTLTSILQDTIAWPSMVCVIGGAVVLSIILGAFDKYKTILALTYLAVPLGAMLTLLGYIGFLGSLNLDIAPINLFFQTYGYTVTGLCLYIFGDALLPSPSTDSVNIYPNESLENKQLGISLGLFGLLIFVMIAMTENTLARCIDLSAGSAVIFTPLSFNLSTKLG